MADKLIGFLTPQRTLQGTLSLPQGGVAPTLQTKSKTYTPSESQQTENVTADSGYDGLQKVAVTVNAVSPSYVGSGVARKSSSDLSASGGTVTAPAGYYENSASKAVASMTLPTSPAASPSSGYSSKATIDRSTSDQYVNIPPGYNANGAYYKVSKVPNGTEGTPSATKGTVSNHSVAVTPSVTNQAGYIAGGTKTGTPVTVQASELVSGNKAITSNGNNIDVTDYATVSVNVPTGSTINNQDKTVNPSTSQQQIQADSGYTGLGTVTVNAMPSGTEGTPSATKGTVSNHSVAVTPSVTNQAGYIAGGTKTGTPVTVSASELDSGNKAITENGNNIDVVGYATVSVNVPTGGGGSTPQEGFTDKTLTAASNTISFTGLSGEPTAFIVMAEADVATGASPYKVASVAFDGTSVFGQIITNTSNANVTFDDSSFSKSYSNGTLTITSTGPQFQEGMYSLLYIYGGSSGNIQTAEVQVGSGATSITFSDLPGASDSWKGTYFLVFQSNFGTSNGYQRVLCVERIGGDLYGLEMDSAAHFSDAHWSESLSNGSLTVSSDGTNAGGYFHQPGYYKLVYVLNEAPEIEIESLTVTQNGTYSESGKAYSPVIVNVAGGGSATVDTKTVNNSDATATSLSFTGLSGQPKAFFVRCTSNLSRSSSNRYYYIADIRWDGSSSGGVAGNKFYVYNGQFSNQTSGYSFTYSNGTLTLSTTGSQSASPGSFFNGTYELVYVY